MEKFVVFSFLNGRLQGINPCNTIEFAREEAEFYANNGADALIVQGEFFKAEPANCPTCYRAARECTCQKS